MTRKLFTQKNWRWGMTRKFLTHCPVRAQPCLFYNTHTKLPFIPSSSSSACTKLSDRCASSKKTPSSPRSWSATTPRSPQRPPPSGEENFPNLALPLLLKSNVLLLLQKVGGLAMPVSFLDPESVAAAPLSESLLLPPRQDLPTTHNPLLTFHYPRSSQEGQRGPPQ